MLALTPTSNNRTTCCGTPPATSNSKTQRHALDVLSSLESMWNETIACDFTVKVGQKSFYVHRALLIACSNYFKAMFSCFTKESIEGVVGMENLEESAVESCIEFMYKGETALSMGNVANILQAVEVMQLGKLKSECMEFLYGSLCNENCISTMRLALMYGCKSLQKQTETYFKVHFCEVTDADEFCLLSKDDALMYVLEFANDDDSKWKAAESWINYISECRKENALDFFNMLNLAAFPSFDLMNGAWRIASVQGCDDIKVQLLRRIFSTVLELSENITVENCFLLYEMADAYSHAVREVKDAIHEFMLKNFPAVTTKEKFGTLKKKDVIALLKSPDALFFSSEKIKWYAAVNWMKANPSSKEGVFSYLLQTIDLKKMSLEFLQTLLKEEPLLHKYPECRQIIVNAGLAKPAEVPESFIALLDTDGDVHVFDMKEKKCHTFDCTAKTANMKIVSMNGNLCVLDGKNLRIAKDRTWVNVSSLPSEPSLFAQVVSCGDCIYVVDANNVSRYCSLSDTWKEEFCFIPPQFHKMHCVASDTKLYFVLSEAYFAFQRGLFEAIMLHAPMSVNSMQDVSAACIREKIYLLQCRPNCKPKVSVCNLTDKKWTTISSPSGYVNVKLCTVGGSLAAFHTYVRDCLKIEIYDEEWDRWLHLKNTPRFKHSKIIQAVCSFHANA